MGPSAFTHILRALRSKRMAAKLDVILVRNLEKAVQIYAGNDPGRMLSLRDDLRTVMSDAPGTEWLKQEFVKIYGACDQCGGPLVGVKKDCDCELE